MIRILHVVGALDRGGIETFLMNLYRSIDRKELQFDFLVQTDRECDYNQEIRELGGRIYAIPSRKHGFFKNRKALRHFFMTHSDYTIIHQHATSLHYIAPLKMAKKYNVHIRIIHSHNIREGSFVRCLLHRLNKSRIQSLATHFFACSNLAAKWVYSKKQINNHQYCVIRNAIHLNKFTNDNKGRIMVRQSLGIGEHQFVIGHVGRFNPQKNHTFIIDIFKKIHQKHKDSILLLVGDGELRSNIEKKVQALSLTGNVIFLGVRSDIPQLMQAMDVFLFPSLYEGLGIVLIEAQTSGMKCFTSQGVVPKDVNVTGLVQFIHLDEPAENWAERIIVSKDYNRVNQLALLKKAGYDVLDLSQKIQRWYETRALGHVSEGDLEDEISVYHALS